MKTQKAEPTKLIELTKEQIEAIDLYLVGRITMNGASLKQRELLSDVIEAAEELMLQLDDFNPEGDLIEYYYGKYKEQQTKKQAREN